jgi:hypothetical protein
MGIKDIYFGYFLAKYPQSDVEKLLALSLFALSDAPVSPVDFIMFHGRAAGDDSDPLFDFAAKLDALR